MNEDQWQLKDWTVDSRRNEVVRDRTVVTLESKAMAVLVYLMQRSGDVVSSDDILAAVWPDRIVEQSTVHRRINQIRAALGDDSRNPRYIETIPRKGYQLLADAVPIDRHKQSFVKSLPKMIALVCLTATAGLFWVWTDRPELQEELVAASLSVNADESVDRILVADFRRKVGEKSFVRVTLSPDSDFRLDMSAPQSDRLVLDLYQLKNGRLIKSLVSPNPFDETWLDRAVIRIYQYVVLANLYDRPETKSERAKALMFELLVTYASIGFDPQATEAKVIALAEQAIRADPDLADLHGWLGYLCCQDLDPKVRRDAKFVHYRRAIELHPTNDVVLHFLALSYYREDRNFELALKAAELALAHGHSPATIERALGEIKLYSGEISEAITHFETAASFDNPVGPWASLMFLPPAFKAIGQPERAITIIDRIESTLGRSHVTVFQRVEALAMLEQPSEAKKFLDENRAFGNENELVSLETWLGDHDKGRKFVERAANTLDEDDSISSWHIMDTYFYLGELDKAVEWLEKTIARQERLDLLNRLYLPQFDELREHPRVQAALATVTPLYPPIDLIN